MSMTFWINIRDGDNHYSNQEDHSAMFSLGEQLDYISLSLGVEEISDFYDSTDLTFSYVEIDNLKDSEEQESWSNDLAKWFDPKSGVIAIKVILNHLEHNPTAIQLNEGGWSLDDVLTELEDCKSELLKAMNQKLSFHFCMLD